MPEQTKRENLTDAGQPLVLVVDDDPAILKAVMRLLRVLPVEVLTVTSPVDALSILGEQDIAVVITDYMMPGLNGIDLLAMIRETWPRTVTIMMTASSDMRVAADAVNRHLIEFFISKPWANPQFIKLVEEAVSIYLKSATEDTQEGMVELSASVAGRIFGKYQLVDQIATGGMAEICRARMHGAGGFEKDVAIKKVLPHLSNDSTFVQMFLDEARTMVTLNQGNIVSVVDFGEVEGEYYLVMEYVDGLDLRGLLELPGKPPNPVPAPIACFIACQVCMGLDYAHRKTDAEGRPLKLVHRDIGPQNVLISREGSVKLTDFGIAKAANLTRRTQSGVVRGTLHYMSSEQICARDTDKRSDIYSLGVVLYEMLTGLLPFNGTTYKETFAHISRGSYKLPHEINRKTDKRLSPIIKKAMRLNPRRRYQTAAEMADDLTDYLHKAGLHPQASDLADFVKLRMTAGT